MITAHQTAENAVRALNLGAEAYLTKPVEVPDLFDTIERIGEIRAAKLTETKRRQEAEEALRDAEQMALVGRVAAMMVHDLRGPLQTIRNSVLLFEMAPEKAEKARELIESAVDQTANMLDELRNSTEKIPLRRETVNLTSLIEKTVEEAYIPNTIALKIVCSEGLDSVILDPSKFRRVLDNLIRNAVEAMPEGGDLSLSTENTEDGFVLKLTDTGGGILEEDIPKIFKPFYTTKPGGMGLGLAYCKRTLEAHGGTIMVESEEGAGSTFRISLPHLREG